MTGIAARGRLTIGWGPSDVDRPEIGAADDRRLTIGWGSSRPSSLAIGWGSSSPSSLTIGWGSSSPSSLPIRMGIVLMGSPSPDRVGILEPDDRVGTVGIG